MLGSELKTAVLQSALTLAFLADQAWRMGDAIARTLYRLLISRTHLLAWTTAAQSRQMPRLGLRGFYLTMMGGTVLALVASLAALIYAPMNWPLILPLAMLWLGGPIIALWSSRAPTATLRIALSDPCLLYTSRCV